MLTNTNILITRQAEYARELLDKIEKLDGNPILCPCFAIKELSNKLPDLNCYELAIFVSRNAVDLIMPKLKNQNITYAAIGQATKAHLMQYQVEVIAPNSASSEELLKILLAEYDVANKRVIVFKGEAGLTFISEQLTKLGAKVTNFNVYRRIKPENLEINLSQIIANYQLDLAIFSCVTSVEFFCQVISSIGADCLYQLPIFVVSDRIATQAKKMQFNQVINMATTEPDSMLEKIVTWKNHAQISKV